MDCNIKICPDERTNSEFRRTTEKRLDAHSDTIDDHERRLSVGETKIDSLVKSIDGLTRALWGIASAALVAFMTLIFNTVFL